MTTTKARLTLIEAYNLVEDHRWERHRTRRSYMVHHLEELLQKEKEGTLNDEEKDVLVEFRRDFDWNLDEEGKVKYDLPIWNKNGRAKKMKGKPDCFHVPMVHFWMKSNPKPPCSNIEFRSVW